MSCEVSENLYVIENDYIRKELITENGRIDCFNLNNKLSGSCLCSQKGSEEFLLSFKYSFKNIIIRASELKIDKVKTENTLTHNKLHLSFKPFKLRDSSVCVELIYELSHVESFFKKHLEFSFAKKGNKPIILDYIDFENLVFPFGLNNWCLPEQKSSHISGFALSLGQPVYVDSFYFGCEFPAAVTTIKNSKTSSAYYNGRTLDCLIGQDKLVSYNYVCGAARGNVFQQVQKAFYSYIRTVSKTDVLRRQYNSWFDNMLNITKEKVTASFLEVEKGLTRYGEKPLDSYVVDDGWNDYTGGFWSFNSNFPDKLYPFSSLSENIGSRFGVWVGPRGGYTNDTPKFAKKIQAAGNGYVNRAANDICVASDKYVKNMRELFLSFQKDFHLNYFKLDGFAQRPCKSKHHDHMTGGYRNMYFYTDLWEKWIKIFNEMHEKGSDDLWINLTCYAPPSPWFLMNVQSLWMQVSDDIGFIGGNNDGSDKDRMLNYRDERYFDFYHNRQFQFPQRCLYNHDPIYGNSSKVEMSDDDFREYLFTMATRGTSFWELYYSYNMMNENKWRINYAALRFIEKNLDTLSNSIIFGTRPSQFGVYGYSCFGEQEGIVSLRNSSSKKMSYTLKLDEKIGVSNLYNPKNMITVLPYTPEHTECLYGYGDEIEVTVEPYRTKIFHFGKKESAISALWAQAKDRKTLEVTFSDTVDINGIVCEQNLITDCKLLSDYMTVLITFKDDFSRQNELNIKVKDVMQNVNNTTAVFDYYEDNKVFYGVFGNNDFSIRATLDGENERILVKQGDELSLRVSSDGYVYFKVGINEIKSQSSVKDIVLVTAVRERNGVLKLYLNGKLDSGANSLPTFLSGESIYCYNSEKVTIYNKALFFDEV